VECPHHDEVKTIPESHLITIRTMMLSEAIRKGQRDWCSKDKSFFLASDGLGALGRGASLMMALKWRVE
jgi:hypothetical protein